MCESTICNDNTLDNINKTQLLKTWKDNGGSKHKQFSVVFSNLIGIGINDICSRAVVCVYHVVKQINDHVIS